MRVNFVILTFCLLVATRIRAENPFSKFLMKKMSSKNESKMKSSIPSGKHVARHDGSESSDAIGANELDQAVAARSEETLKSLEKELDDAQASHQKVSTNQKSAEEQVKALEKQLSEFRALSTLHLQRMIEAAHHHQTQRIAAVVQEYDERFSDMQRRSENALTEQANAAMAEKDAELASTTADYEARNIELEIQLKRAETAHEKALKAEQESIVRMNDSEKQLEDLRASMAVEMDRKANELAALKAPFDDITIKSQNELDLAMTDRDAALEAEQKAIEKIKELEQASEVLRIGTAEGGIAVMADTQVQSDLMAATTKLTEMEEELAALKMENEQLKYQDQQQLKLSEDARDAELERVRNFQKECEDLLVETKGKMVEVTKETDERISQRIAEIENAYGQRLADAQEKAGLNLSDVERALAAKEKELTVLKERYEEQITKSLTQLELAEAERDAAVEVERRASEKMKEMEHASAVLLSETTVTLEQRINEIEANATQRINVLTDAQEQSERALTVARAELIEKEKAITTLKVDYEQLQFQDQQKLELAESARDDALERIQYVQQEYESLLEKTKVEIKEAARAADNRVAQFAINTEQHYAQRLSDAREQAKHDLAIARGELADKEEELVAMLAQNEALKTAEATANKRIADAKADAAKKEAQLTTLMTEYDFIAFDSRVRLENAESERNTAIEEKNKALQAVEDLEEALQSETLLVDAQAKLDKFEIELAILKAEFESCKAKSQQQLEIIEDARITAFATKQELDEKSEQIEELRRFAKEEAMRDAQKLAQVEQDYIRRLSEVQTRSEEALADAMVKLERKELELEVLKDEYDENSARDKNQLKLAISAQDAAVHAKAKSLDMEQATQSDKNLVDVLKRKDEELVVLAAKFKDAQALYDEQLSTLREDVKMKEEELAILSEKFDEAEARYREDLDAIMLKVEKNEQELAALQAEYTDAQSRSEQDISTSKEVVKEKEKELMVLKEALAVQAAELEAKLEETNVELRLELSQKEVQYWVDNFSGPSNFNFADGLHRIKEAPALLKDSSEKSVALLMSETQTTADHYRNKTRDLDGQNVDTFVDVYIRRYKRLFWPVHFGMDYVYSFFLDCIGKIIFHVRIHCPLVESDLKASGPLWVHDSVREACLDPREAVSCFFQVVCLLNVFLMRRMLWRLLSGTIVKFSQVILFISSTCFFGRSASKDSAIKGSVFHVRRRLKGSPKKRAE